MDDTGSDSESDEIFESTSSPFFWTPTAALFSILQARSGDKDYIYLEIPPSLRTESMLDAVLNEFRSYRTKVCLRMVLFFAQLPEDIQSQHKAANAAVKKVEEF